MLCRRLGPWLSSLPKNVRPKFEPLALCFQRPFTVQAALDEKKVAQNPGLAVGWAKEYQEYPDFTLQAMQEIRDALRLPASKAEAVEIVLLTTEEAKNWKDAAVAAEAEFRFNFLRRHGAPVTGEDAKKARKALAKVGQAISLSVGVTGKRMPSLTEIIKGKKVC